MKTDTPEKCTHKMAEMPRWLSSSKMEVVKSILSDDPVRSTIPTRAYAPPRTILAFFASYSGHAVRSFFCSTRLRRALLTFLRAACRLRESMGLASDGTHKAFRAADVDAFLARPRLDIYVDIMSYNSRGNTNHFVVSVDPSGGGTSAFAVASMCQLPTGQLVVRAPHAPRPCATHPPHTPPRRRWRARRRPC